MTIARKIKALFDKGLLHGKKLRIKNNNRE